MTNARWTQDGIALNALGAKQIETDVAEARDQLVGGRGSGSVVGNRAGRYRGFGHRGWGWRLRRGWGGGWCLVGGGVCRLGLGLCARGVDTGV